MQSNRTPYVNPRNVIRVIQGESIQAAIDRAVAAGMTALNPYAIVVYPGVYQEQVVMSPGAHLVGVDRKGCVITFANNVVSMSADSSIENVTVKTPSLSVGGGTTAITGTANDLTGIVVKDCDITGRQWCFEGVTGISARIEGCYFSAPNPICWGFNNALIANNLANYSGAVASCFGFIDAIDGMNNTTVIGNKVYMAHTDATPGNRYWLRFCGNNNRFINNHALMDGVECGWWIFGGNSRVGLNYFHGNNIGCIGRDNWPFYNWYLEGFPGNDFCDIVSLANQIWARPSSGSFSAHYGLFITDALIKGLNWTLDAPSIDCAVGTGFTFDGKNASFELRQPADLELL